MSSVTSVLQPALGGKPWSHAEMGTVEDVTDVLLTNDVGCATPVVAGCLSAVGLRITTNERNRARHLELIPGLTRLKVRGSAAVAVRTPLARFPTICSKARVRRARPKSEVSRAGPKTEVDQGVGNGVRNPGPKVSIPWWNNRTGNVAGAGRRERRRTRKRRRKRRRKRKRSRKR